MSEEKGDRTMSMLANRLRRMFAENDAKRDSTHSFPPGVEIEKDISYGEHGVWSLLDVFRLADAQEKLPCIVNIHGGGFFYGTKEVYRFYCAYLASKGFVVVSFNYRLAPESRFPAQLADICAVLDWLKKNADDRCVDLDNVFFAGDSAGAHLAMNMCVLMTDPQYAELIKLEPPAVRPRALLLNCGLYDLRGGKTGTTKWMVKNYGGRRYGRKSEAMNSYDRLNAEFPPAYIASAYCDFLLPESRDMDERLTVLGIEHVFKIYGSEERPQIGHVFHVDVDSDEAIRCNDDECAFLKGCIKK